MKPDDKIIHWARVWTMVGTIFITLMLIAFIYYLINIWLPAQERKKTELKIRQIEQEILQNQQ